MTTSIQDRVWAAVRAGAETAREVEAVTGLPLKSLSGALSNLAARGWLVRIGQVTYPDASGRPPNSRYRVAGDRPPSTRRRARVHGEGRCR